MSEKNESITSQAQKPVALKASLCNKVARVLLPVIKWGLGLSFPLLVVVLLIDIGTSYLVNDRIYTEIKQLPKRDYAVVLGTAKYYPTGTPNLYYKYRLEAAKQLYRQQKANVFLMSGDNKTAYYNEPKMMTADLRQMGVPSGRIRQDYAGYNTLDSIVRADKVFKLKPFTIVSQRFHCERALVIAKFHNIDAICYVAKYPDKHYQVRIREVVARVAMVWNLLTGAEPTTLDAPKIVEPLKAKSAS